MPVEPYQHCRPLTDEEYLALKADIADNGVLEYVHVDEEGQILVGHHRARAAAELGIEYPRHVVVGLTEQEKHAYAVKLESLGRAKDDETRRYTVLDLWQTSQDPNHPFKANQRAIAELVGIPRSTASEWIRAYEVELQESSAHYPPADSTLAEPNRVIDSRGRAMPTTYQPRQPTAASAPSSANGAVSVAADPDLDPDDEEDDGPPPPGQYPGRSPGTTQNPPPTLGEVMGERAGQFDDAGLAEAEAARKRHGAAVYLRIELLRLAQAHDPEVMVETELPEDLPVIVASLDLVIDWLQRARALAADPRAQIRRVP